MFHTYSEHNHKIHHRCVAVKVSQGSDIVPIVNEHTDGGENDEKHTFTTVKTNINNVATSDNQHSKWEYPIEYW